MRILLKMILQLQICLFFYQEVFVSFNKCKMKYHVINHRLTNIYNNLYGIIDIFVTNGKSLCYITWVKSGILYVKRYV